MTQDYNGEWLFIDVSVIKAHEHSFGAASRQDEVTGKSVASNSSKRHLLVDACGNPVHIEVTSGQLHDSQMKNNLIEQAIKDDTEVVVADKGYDSQDFGL